MREPRRVLSPLEELTLVERQCTCAFRDEARDMQTPHGGERVDEQAGVEPVDVLAVSEPPLGVEDDILGGL